MTTTKLTHTTRTIAGHEITLAEGVRYMATRPMASRRGQTFPVTIRPVMGAPLEAENVVLPALSYDAANEFLTEFNNGAMSFDGRVWASAAECEVCEETPATGEEVVLGTTRALCAGCREGGIENGALGAADATGGAR